MKNQAKTETTTDFPIPEFTALDAAFGADIKTYLPREKIPDQMYAMRGKHADAASGLFFKGGRLEDFGLRLKPGIDRKKAFTAISAWLCSFAPSHEQKIGTVAYALSQWCEDVPA